MSESVLEKYLIAEILRCNREIKMLQHEIDMYERMLKKLRQEKTPPKRGRKV